jgi:UDP-2-acetamido-2-deoxy-ribo-hexuluronate aminotransferase
MRAAAKMVMMMDFIDLKTPYALLKSEVDTRIRKVLEHGQYIMGPEVAELEERLAGLAGARHCITVASGTEALLIALMALGIGPGDEVITPSFTFAATAEVIVLAGARPVFVDIEPDTCNVDVRKVESKITPRTRAIMPVSLYGQPCDMDELGALAERHGLVVIEDAAQSFGAIYGRRWSCNLSKIGCTSFFPSKPLGCYGDGGAIFTGDDALAQAMREIRVHGQSRRYHHTRVGVGGRMDTIQCAIVLAKLDRFEWEIAQRLEVGERYNRLFGEAGIKHVTVRNGRTSVYAQYTVFTANRDSVQARLKADGIPTAVHYPTPIHHQPAYQAYADRSDCPNASLVATQVLSLPMHPYLDAAVQTRIVDAVIRALRDTQVSAA